MIKKFSLLAMVLLAFIVSGYSTNPAFTVAPFITDNNDGTLTLNFTGDDVDNGVNDLEYQVRWFEQHDCDYLLYSINGDTGIGDGQAVSITLNVTADTRYSAQVYLTQSSTGDYIRRDASAVLVSSTGNPQPSCTPIQNTNTVAQGTMGVLDTLVGLTADFIVNNGMLLAVSFAFVTLITGITLAVMGVLRYNLKSSLNSKRK